MCIRDRVIGANKHVCSSLIDFKRGKKGGHFECRENYIDIHPGQESPTTLRIKNRDRIIFSYRDSDQLVKNCTPSNGEVNIDVYKNKKLIKSLYFDYRQRKKILEKGELEFVISKGRFGNECDWLTIR